MTATMRIRRLDENWDLVFGSGDKDFLTGVEAAAQAVKQHLQLFLGEWWNDTEAGLPMWQSILGVFGAGQENIDRLIIARILDTTINGAKIVTAVKSFSSAIENHEYTCSCSVDTIFGETGITYSFARPTS